MNAEIRVLGPLINGLGTFGTIPLLSGSIPKERIPIVAGGAITQPAPHRALVGCRSV